MCNASSSSPDVQGHFGQAPLFHSLLPSGWPRSDIARGGVLARTLQVYRDKHYKKEFSMVWTRNYPVVIGTGVAVLLFSLVGAAAITGGLPQDIGRHNPLTTPLLNTTASAAAAKNGDCRNCGFIAAIRPLEVTGGGSVRKVYRVTVHMDDGSERSFSQAKQPTFPVGSRVRMNGDAIERG
jgi:hypothetical protein